MRKIGTIILLIILYLSLFSLLTLKSNAFPEKKDPDIEFFFGGARNIDIKVFDLNKDGLNDIIVSPNSQTYSTIFYQRYNHTISNKADKLLNRSGQIILEDINKDNLIDIFMKKDDRFFIYYQPKDKIFNSLPDIEIYLQFPTMISAPALGDINNDNLLDVILITDNNKVIAYNQSINHTFQNKHAKILSGFYHAIDIKVGDINNNGFDDICILDFNEPGKGVDLKIFYQQKNNIFNSIPDIKLIPNDYYRGYEFELGDLNNDRLLDIMVQVDSGGEAVIFYQHLDNKFNKYPDYRIEYVYSISINDFNSDGLSDLLYCLYGELESKFQCQYQNLDGNLNESENLIIIKKKTISSKIYFGIGDINRSGLKDIIVLCDYYKNNTYYSDMFIYYQEGLDSDGDGYLDGSDDFPNDPDEWVDVDNDGIGNNQDEDNDGDGLFNKEEDKNQNNKLDEGETDPNNNDTDYDGVNDDKDIFPRNPNESLDFDKDGIGDNSDNDDDNDNYNDTIENFENTNQFDNTSIPIDNDQDYIPDSIDFDIDGDNISNDIDKFPYDSTEWLDTDSDGIGNNEDSDDDNDGFNDTIEYIIGTNSSDNNSIPKDMDNDNIPNKLDNDIDGDGKLNNTDMYPEDPSKWKVEEKEKGISWLFIIRIILLIFIIISIIFGYYFYRRKDV